jgi:uncharacterized RDD family membrane protein YckC
MAAAVIDAIVVALILAVLYAAVATVIFMVDPLGFDFPQLSWVFDLMAGLGVTVLYLTVAWVFSGRTYGKHVMGLRVVNYRGQRLRWLGALARALACTLFPIGLLWCAVSPENRSLQDVLLRTSVIYDWQPADAPGRLRP